ncbi:cyanophycin synthetase family protein [Sphingobacterium thalpophilum]|uniref:cyanophycin synthetase family protein n=1 Tax=Sphingobacterium thalpophilum TaxID=259 RepID=UPI0024A6B762|nr:hypothetical protein [Sphingobacterium thalpophilum]
MRIKELKVLRGPNLWSIRRQQLVQMVLDIGRYEELPTHCLPGFTERLVNLIPSLYSHRCSEGQGWRIYQPYEAGDLAGACR